MILPLVLAFGLLLLPISSGGTVTPPRAPSEPGVYSPPRDNLELSVACANYAIAHAKANNALANPDEYCKRTIGDTCAPVGLTLEECYAYFFAPVFEDIPADVKASIGVKVEAFKAQEQNP